MKNSDNLLQNYDYIIPEELIAQFPTEKRENSKFIVLDRKEQTINHRNFSDIVDILNDDDCLVINTTKVVPARLYGKKKTGGKVEILFLNPTSVGATHTVLLKPYVKSGDIVYFEDGYECVVSNAENQKHKTVNFNKNNILALLEKYGLMPLPPYIKRKDNLAQELSSFDRERYQTVYANSQGAIAAPTAGLHFTKDILHKLKNKNVKIAEIILHVGWGTFKPIATDEISAHKMLPESYILDELNAKIINNAISENKRIIAVGTTTVRTLETIANIYGIYNEHNLSAIKSCNGQTDIFIYPGYNFKIVKSMITNLHLPCSTPLLMASAFAGRDFILSAYKQAIDRKYRFFSYGDSMFIQ
ncbi:MAG: tRNA preQ1(34) S-adenosylmethionine ribosyltransferase-isomerase QueA [Endomicrobiaceae bacterium]|nr:tRNA preQ1(34) S-adenosylmethionine ribosyltransferase-isomerase QueA [Endomicrobiaceae bacterium]